MRKYLCIFFLKRTLTLNMGRGGWDTSLGSKESDNLRSENLQRHLYRCSQSVCQGSRFSQLESWLWLNRPTSVQHSTVFNIQSCWSLTLMLIFAFPHLLIACDEVSFHRLWFSHCFQFFAYFKCLNHVTGQGSLLLNQANPAYHQWTSEQVDCHLVPGKYPLPLVLS